MEKHSLLYYSTKSFLHITTIHGTNPYKIYCIIKPNLKMNLSTDQKEPQMKKSKETIRKTLILIVLLLLTLALLESNSFYKIRTFVASTIPFFQGKRVLFSNILIGILGSAIILVFGEIITYRHEKQQLHLEILKLYQEWNNHIINIATITPSNFQGLSILATHIEKYAAKVNLIYNNYVPFFRAGAHFQLLRTLYKYTNAVTEYADTISRHTNQKLALLNSIAQCNTSKSLANSILYYHFLPHYYHTWY